LLPTFTAGLRCWAWAPTGIAAVAKAVINIEATKRGRPTNVRIFIVFYPRAGVILTRASNVVYLHRVEEWLPCVPEVVSNLVDQNVVKSRAARDLPS
jgi:hypothetical protein